jgi:hypothetical protein
MYAAFLKDDYPVDQIDAFGYARLRERARDQKLQLVGEVTRVYDVPAVGIPAAQPDGTTAITYVEATSDAAGGRAPDARLVRWEIEVEPVTTTDPFRLEAVVLGEGTLAKATLPSQVTENGGLVEFPHQLGGEVTVRAFGPDGEVGYTYGVPIDDDTHELMLPPGAQRLEAVRDSDDEEGPQ